MADKSTSKGTGDGASGDSCSSTQLQASPSSASEKRKSTEPSAAEPGSKRPAGFSLAFSKTSKPKLQNLTSQKDDDANITSAKVAKNPTAPIKLTLSSQKPKEGLTLKKKIAAVFDDDDDDSEEEEMPPEARMKMKNIGRETPTAAGPNSFGKGNLGFCDRRRIIERDIQKQMDDLPSSKK